MTRVGRRRLFRGGLAVAGLGLLAGCGVLPPRAAPSVNPRRIGFLLTRSPEADDPLAETVRQGLRDLGYAEGRDVAFEDPFEVGGTDPPPGPAARLVGLGPDVIVGGAQAALAAKAATDTIPIVIATVADPVGLGLVASLAQPGGNVTGLSSLATGLTRKRLDLLVQASPGIGHVGVPWYATSPAGPEQLHEAQAAARQLGIRVQPIEVPGPDELERALAAGAGGRGDALMVPGDPRMFADRGRIVAVAAGSGLPAVYTRKEWAAPSVVRRRSSRSG